MNNLEFVLWGRKNDEKDEGILAERIPTIKQANEIMERAEKAGFIDLRIQKIDFNTNDIMNNFIKAIN